MAKKTRHTFVKIAKITAVYIAANLLTHGFQRKIHTKLYSIQYFDDVTVTYSASK